MACKECIENVSSECIQWEGDSSLGCDLHEIVKNLSIKNNDVKTDLKTLSSVDLKQSQVVQLLVDEILKLQNKVSNLTVGNNASKIDCFVPIGNSESNDICTILTYIVNDINSLKLELNNLKNNGYL
jgi:hypothetical protein